MWVTCSVYINSYFEENVFNRTLAKHSLLSRTNLISHKMQVYNFFFSLFYSGVVSSFSMKILFTRSMSFLWGTPWTWNLRPPPNVADSLLQDLKFFQVPRPMYRGTYFFIILSYIFIFPLYFFISPHISSIFLHNFHIFLKLNKTEQQKFASSYEFLILRVYEFFN